MGEITIKIKYEWNYKQNINEKDHGTLNMKT